MNTGNVPDNLPKSILMNPYNEDAGHEISTDLRHDIFDNLLGDEITSALNSLNIEHRLIIILCDVEGFKYEEIASIVDIPVGTVRSRLHRARKLLKEKLQGLCQKKRIPG
jgi:RNA polymerase sigma factor (sigma-70 family)